MGRRHDLHMRPELMQGTVEYAASKEYCSRDPQPAGIVFVIDVSYASVQSGMLASACQGIREALDVFPTGLDTAAPAPCKIGIITFDKSVHFYSLVPTLAQPQMMVVSDVTDIFVPISTGMLSTVAESRDIIETLLERLPHMFASTRETDAALGAAMQAAMLALQPCGGRAVVLSSSLPSFGPGTLKKREDVSLLGTEKEKILFQPQDGYYKAFATDCIKRGICIDLFMFPNAYQDVATLGAMATSTGGSVHRMPLFKGANDGEKLVAEIKYCVQRVFGTDAMMRLRCSTGLRPTDFFGNFVMNNTQDVEMAGVDADTCVTIRIKHDDKLADNSDAHFQVALLYTTASGQRRIRVHTLSLRVGSQYPDIFRAADMDALLCFIPKLGVRDALAMPLAAVREKLTGLTVAILLCYRKHCTNPNSAAGQLILPEALKLLPAYAASIIRNIAFRPGGDVGSDERVHAMQQLQGMSPRDVVPFLYPRMVSLHDVLEGEGEVIPASIRASYARLKEHGVYLLETGQDMFMWIGRAVAAPWVQQVIGAAAFQSIDVAMATLPVLGNPLSTRVREVIAAMRAERNPFMKLHIIKQKDPAENIFLRHMVEDKFNDLMSYVDFLCHVHREVQVAYSK